MHYCQLGEFIHNFVFTSIIDEDQKTCTLITSSNIDHHKVREEIDEYLRYIEHEFPNSAESATKLWKHFNDTFQVLVTIHAF